MTEFEPIDGTGHWRHQREIEIGRYYGVRLYEYPDWKRAWYFNLYSWFWCEVVCKLPEPLFNLTKKVLELFKEIKTAIFEPDNLNYGFRPIGRVRSKITEGLVGNKKNESA